MSGRGWLVALFLLVGMAAAALAFFRAEGTAPSVELPGSVLVGKPGSQITTVLSDPGSGLRSVSVVWVRDGSETSLASKVYTGSFIGGGVAKHPDEIVVSISPERLGAKSGTGVLRVSATDWSWRSNQTVRETSVTIDLDAPRVSPSSGLTYVRRGGAAAVLYNVSEATEKDGVQVGKPDQPGSQFYRGYPARGGMGGRIAVFAVAADAPTEPNIRVVATDAAGNVGQARWPVFVNERAPSTDRINLSQRFLESKVAPLASSGGIASDDLVKAFHAVNTEMRSANETRIRELTAESGDDVLWNGAFLQLANSKVTSQFAEQRSYFVEGEQVSTATHYGYDLASTQAAPITASNAGRIVFSGELGIYGQCVLIDHGLGVASLYGHLSRLDVAAGDSVGKGDRLGLSGATGLAGGDHLHFAMLVGRTYVDPIEWWDPKWVQINIASRLTPSTP